MKARTARACAAGVRRPPRTETQSSQSSAHAPAGQGCSAWRSTTQYSAMQCNAKQHKAIKCNAMQCNTIPYHTIPYNAMPAHVHVV